MTHPEALPSAPQEVPHWEHGYRSHGYWLDGVRLGVVSIGPKGWWNPKQGYRWEVTLGGRTTQGEEKNLRLAKRQVERHYQEFRSKAP